MEVIGDFVFFTQGRKLLSLELESHKIKTHLAHSDEITTLAQSCNTLYSGSRDGLIIKWSLPSLISYKISSPIKLLAASPDCLYFLKANTLSLYKLDLQSDTYSSTSFFRGALENSLTLKFTADYSSLALLTSHSVVLLHLQTQTSRLYEHSVPLTVLSLHPQGKYIAVGDSIGQIVKIYEGKNSKMHWHSHKVLSLAFTPDGNFMVSGGEEGVAVLWHESTGERTYLPRLGSSISAISVSSENNFYIIKLVTGAVRVFRTSDYKQVGGHLCLVDPARLIPGTRVRTGIVWQENSMVLNAAPGFLQFFEPESGEVRFVDCEARNPVSRTQEEHPCPLHVIQVAFVQGFMATLQVSVSKYMTISLLKFWENGKVNTLVMHPHSDTAKILVAHGERFVSLGKDSFVLWEQRGQWSGCIERSRGGLECRAACSRGDLYVGFGHVLTQWDERMECVKEVFEPLGHDIVYLQATEEEIVVGTSSEVHVVCDGIIGWSISLGYIHGIVAEGKYFAVALNASKYTPHETRMWKSNIILKFRSDKSVPERIYKVDAIAAFSMRGGNTIVIDKFFEYTDLDRETVSVDENFPESVRVVKNNETKTDIGSKNNNLGLVPRYSQASQLKWLGDAVSHELPSSEEFFSQIVLEACKYRG